MLLIENVTKVEGSEQVSVGVSTSNRETTVSIYRPRQGSRLAGETIVSVVLTEEQKKELKQYL